MTEARTPPQGESPEAMLGVTRSVGGRRWVRRPGDERQALAISQRLGVPEVLGRVLAGRGVTVESAPVHLDPTLRALLPDPAHLRDMDRAVARLAAVVQAGETLGVFGDYDVDGATSTALLHRFFRDLGVPVRVHIPDRLEEGYGPNTPALLRLQEAGATVVITVDCGISAFEPLAEARAAGLEIIVCDHHEARAALPEALAVINPKRLDETSPHRHLAAVGVAFLLIVGVNRALRDAGWFEKAGRAPPDLMTLLDLVALGTVCDMVPLVGVNRALVRQGLKVIARRGNPGLNALAEVARVSEAMNAFHLGFLLGPRVNAGGRVGEAGMGSALLASDDPVACLEMARHLDAWNAARKDIEAEVLAQAIEQAESAPPADVPLVFVVGRDWHPGVLGIVASRLKERYGLPACVVALEGGLAKGSGRSVTGLDLGRAVIAAREAGLLEAGGGHAMAAGFTVTEAALPAFRAFLGEGLLAQKGEDMLESRLDLDGLLDVKGVTPDLVRALDQAGPFGAGNPDPVFALPGVRVIRADVVGTGHVRCILGGVGGGSLKGMAFRAADSEIGHALLSAGSVPVHVAGQIRADTWQGRDGVQFLIEDVARAPS
ncbi:single-stranded-DNA-specific exonuclease RecJ [Pararhodospirillum oryzae]|uniref:Single-stranded-DNA-specific exonuclease RecJ n=1 Tax=Pararhodospirillum oryzae TaxID=478448 RepID=A0A512H750_9PROT|nr:single-stranded-DNA-specific exonuclease RecJ [Pararhodospirillum oryzae]GEO81261.1 single-stranded-DNA-specific exonuclease RecJ [Pararhodospirillum oryzae]